MPDKFDCENVNGVMLSLNIDGKSKTSNSRTFTITYTNKLKSDAKWPKTTLFCAVLFNIIGLIYAHITLMVVVITITVFSVLMFFWLTHCVQSESVFVVPSVGIQSTVKYVLGQEDHFIPWNNIEDIIINEVIKLNRVLYFLTVLSKDSPNSGLEDLKLFPLFKYTKPRLQMIEKMYCEMQNLLSADLSTTTMAAGDIG